MKKLFKTILLVCVLYTNPLKSFGANTYDWTGSSGTDWGATGNWKFNGGTSSTVPGASPTDIVQIGVNYAFTNQPTLNSGTTTTIASLTFGVKANSTLTVNGGSVLAVTGNITQNASTALLLGSGTLTTTLAGGGSITCASLNVGSSSVYLSVLNTNNLNVVSTISSLHITGNITVNSTDYGILFVGLARDNATFSLQGGTTAIDGTILTANTKGGLLSFAGNATPTFSVDIPSATSPILQLTNAVPIDPSSVAGTIDFYNNTGGTGTSTVYYSGTGNQEVYSNPTAALNTSPSVYQNLSFSGSGTKKADAGNVTVSKDLTLAPGTEIVDFAANNPVITVGGNFTSNSGTTLNQGGTGTMSITGTSGNGGTLNQTGSGSITFTGALTNTGTLTQSSTGGITAYGGITNSGAIMQQSGASGGISITGALVNNGTLTQTSGNITVSTDVTNSGTLTLGTANLTISGNYTNTGTYLQSTGITLFNGSSAETLQGGSGTGTPFNKVNFSGTGPKTMTSGVFSVSSLGILTMMGSSTLAANGYLTLKSDATGSATVATIPSGASITGAVNVQRFITGNNDPKYRNYRLVSSPVNTGTQDAYHNYIYSVNYLIATDGTTTGTYVSGYNFPPTSAASPNTKQGNPSIYLFRENLAPLYTSFINSNFRAIASLTNSPTYSFTADPNYSDPDSTIPIGNGYDLYFRGGEATASPFVAGSTPANGIVVATGILNQGPVTVHDWYTPNSDKLGVTNTIGTGSTPPNNSLVRGFNLVGNPYASSIDLNTLDTTNTTAGIYAHRINPVIYFLNPTAQSYDEYDTETGQAAGSNIGVTTNIIPSGLGFFVIATDSSASQLTFNESAKVNTQVAGMSLYMGKPLAINTAQFIRLQMIMDTLNTDATLIHFKSQASPAYDIKEDAPYRSGNGKVSLASATGDHVTLMAVNRMPLKDKIVTIPLNVNTTANGTYSLAMLNIQGIPQLYDIWLMDTYKNDSLDMRHNTTYTFNVNKADTATFGSYRFKLIMRQDPAYAYQLLNFTANKLPAAIRRVQVNWAVANEGNYTNFTVERSTDGGTTFDIIGNVHSAGQGTYSFTDNTPSVGANSYRLQQEDFNNVITYSKIITIQYANLSNQLGNKINVFPNPASSTINLAVTTDTTNTTIYNIKFMNSLGLIVKDFISQNPTSQTNISDLQPGTYVIQVFNDNSQKLVGENKFVKL